MKKKKITYKPDFDFDLLGISSSENDYKISWHISNCLETDFLKSNDLKITDSKVGEEQTFSVFENFSQNQNSQIKLISNKGNFGYLIPELKNIDYFLLIADEEDNFIDDFILKLKSLPEVIAVFKLNLDNIKSKEKLIF